MQIVDAMLSAAAEQAADGLLLTDVSGVIRYVNAAFGRMTGYGRDEVIGRHVRLLKSGQHEAAFYQTLWATLSDGRAWSGVFVNRRKDGGLYEDHTVISPVRDPAGAIAAYFAVKRDVTLERQAERRLRQAQRLDGIGRLAGGVAHDFNNALMTIMGHAEMLEQRLGCAKASCDEIEEIKRACDRAAALTRQLLAFGRRQVRSLAVVDVNQALLGLEKMLRRLLGDNIRLAIVPWSRPALVRFEVGQLEQIIMALAVRARDAMPGGGAFTVSVGEAESARSSVETASVSPRMADTIVVRVADSGVVLDRDDLERIFEPFSTTICQPWESGLALATAHALVTQSGGRIAVRSAPGDGTAFTISLPTATADVAAPTASGRRLGSLSGSETVLLAEDEAGVRELVRLGLVRLGYTVIDAPDGSTALERAATRGRGIDLLITDVVMPGMSARELAERLLTLHPKAKVMYMSGYSDAAIKDQVVPGQGVVFLQKPFTPEALARRVREVLG